jgi:hypothetical protein
MTEPDVLAYRLTEAEREIAEMRRDIKLMRKEAEDRERSRLVAGVGALGSLVLALFGVIWAYRAEIFK